MTETNDRIEMTSEVLQHGYKSCRTTVKNCFKNQLFMTGNLPGDKRRGLDAVLAHIIRSLDMLDLESADGLPLDVWCEVRDQLSDTLSGNPATEELAALADAVRIHEIPRQYLFDILDGVDHWIRNRKFDTFDDLLVFAYRIGGASMAACVPVLGFEKPGYETAAIKCGQAVMLTHLLANCVTDLKQNKNYLPLQDIEECEVVLHRLKLRQGGEPFRHLVRLMCSRIEKLFYEGGQLVSHMDFDGARTVKSLLSMYWQMLIKMQREPELAEARDDVLARRDMFSLKSKHLLGLEGKIPVIPEDHGDHEHH